MRVGQSPEQTTLFEMAELGGRAEVPSAASEMAARSSGRELTGSAAGEPRRKEAGPFRAVSPFGNLPLHEVCAFCGAEVHTPGFIIMDYEELGVFCNEACGDMRFRLYLDETADEDSGFDDDVDPSPS